MKPIVVLACASLSFALPVSPLAAQELSQAEQLPPPPPFPPMPSAQPSHRFVALGGTSSRARSKPSPAHHALAVKSDSKAHAKKTASKSRKASKAAKASKGAKASKSHKDSASHRTVRKEEPMHFSAKTIRSCHAMTYRQIVRSSSCRTMIQQELAAPAHQDRTSKKPSAKHKDRTNKASAKGKSRSAKHKSSSRAKTAESNSKAKKRKR